MTFEDFKKTFFKKRYIIFGLIAMELASLPAAAKLINHYSVEEVSTASVVLIDKIEGRKRFAVASNAPFYISTEASVGLITVRIHKSGQIGLDRFGDNAQMPGAALACSSLNGERRTIYQSKRKTALNKGDILSQAVIVAVHYEDATDPTFKIDVGSPESPKAPLADCFSLGSIKRA